MGRELYACRGLNPCLALHPLPLLANVGAFELPCGQTPGAKSAAQRHTICVALPSPTSAPTATVKALTSPGRPSSHGTASRRPGLGSRTIGLRCSTNRPPSLALDACSQPPPPLGLPQAADVCRTSTTSETDYLQCMRNTGLCERIAIPYLLFTSDCTPESASRPRESCMYCTKRFPINSLLLPPGSSSASI